MRILSIYYVTEILYTFNEIIKPRYILLSFYTSLLIELITIFAFEVRNFSRRIIDGCALGMEDFRKRVAERKVLPKKSNEKSNKRVENLMGCILHELLVDGTRYATVSFLFHWIRGGGNVWPIIFTHIGRHWVTEIIDKVIPALHESWSHASFRIISTRFFIKNLTAFEKSSLCSILNASLFLPHFLRYSSIRSYRQFSKFSSSALLKFFLI